MDQKEGVQDESHPTMVGFIVGMDSWTIPHCRSIFAEIPLSCQTGAGPPSDWPGVLHGRIRWPKPARGNPWNTMRNAFSCAGLHTVYKAAWMAR